MEYNRAQLKQGVKEQIKSTRPRPLWITLLFLVITAAGGWVINLLMSSLNWSGAIANYFLQLTVQGVEAEEAAEYILQLILRNGAEMISLIILGSLLIAFVTYLWESLMGVGYKGYCLDVARGRQPGVGRLFQAFPRIGGVLLTRILTWVFTFLWSLLFLLGFLVVLFIGLALVSVSSLLGGLVIFAGIVAYAVAATWLSLRYSLADYALLDGASGLEAIRTSKQLMRGNYRRLFVLRLSFIGWYLLMFAVALVGAILMGILMVTVGGGLIAGGAVEVADFMVILGVFWVVLLIVVVAEVIISLWLTPYLTASEARFYDFFRGNAAPRLDEPGSGSGAYTGDYSSYSWSGQPGQSGRSEGWDQPQQEPREPEQPQDDGAQGGEDPKDTPPSGPSYPKY